MGEAGVGVVIWDGLGLVIASISEQNSLSRLIAEVEDMAAVRALVFAKWLVSI